VIQSPPVDSAHRLGRTRGPVPLRSPRQRCCDPDTGFCATAPGVSTQGTSAFTLVARNFAFAIHSQVCAIEDAALGAAGCVSFSCNVAAVTTTSATFAILVYPPPVPSCTGGTTTETCKRDPAVMAPAADAGAGLHINFGRGRLPLRTTPHRLALARPKTIATSWGTVGTHPARSVAIAPRCGQIHIFIMGTDHLQEYPSRAACGITYTLQVTFINDTVSGFYNGAPVLSRCPFSSTGTTLGL